MKRHSDSLLGWDARAGMRRSRVVLASVSFFMAVAPVPSFAVDWAQVKGRDIVLFYPAQMSWELLLTQSEHSGAAKFRDGKNCRQCHEGEEAASGKVLVTDKATEPAPIAGKPGFIKANVKIARDEARLYVRIDFNPGNQPDAGMDPDYPVKVAVMIDDGKVAEAGRAGCYAACHDNLARMPSGGDGDTTKYLTRSRIKMARTGSNDVKPADELAKIRGDGGYLEYWQARLVPGGTPSLVEGTILDKRTESTAPVVTATASLANGVWSVIFSRKLLVDAAHKEFSAGKAYTLGFSVHAGHTARRFHYVSLEKTLVIDQGRADFVAVRK